MINFKTFGILLLISIVALLSFNFKEKKIKQKPVANTPEASYQTYCSGCHGVKMNAFVDRDWKHGKTPEDLFKSIKYGYKNDGMPAFSETFKDEEIKALANYISKGIENIERYTEKEKPDSDIFETEEGKIKLELVFDKAKNPWGMAFLPNKKIIVTDKSGELYLVNEDKTSIKIANVPAVRFAGQGGLMDVILHPNFATNQIIYLSYSKPHPTSADLQTTAILKAYLNGNTLVDAKDVFVALPYSKTKHHYGSRMVFGKDGLLYFSVGERGKEKENPQEIKNNALGKVHRITDKGEIPKDNPFYGNANAEQSIYSYGHRNPQGLTLNPFTNEIWSNEHGPRGGDEINIHKKGANYGWPIVSYGINYNGKIITPLTQKAGITDPIHYWNPSIAPSGMAFVNSNIYKGWKGNLMVGSLRFEYLNRCIIKNGKVIKEELLFKNIGRLRDVRMAPNGYLYIAVEGKGVYKLLPN